MKVIFSNIIGFDGLIFLVAAAEIFIFIRAKAAAEALYKAMHKHVYAPSYQDDISSIHEGMESMTDLKLSSIREKAVSAYTIYMNLTGIFPLLGILGTVISLIGMVGDTSDIEGNFFAALTSTFWGLIFAIVFKFLDAFISPKLDDGERAAELFMQRRPNFGARKREEEGAGYAREFARESARESARRGREDRRDRDDRRGRESDYEKTDRQGRESASERPDRQDREPGSEKTDRQGRESASDRPGRENASNRPGRENASDKFGRQDRESGSDRPRRSHAQAVAEAMQTGNDMPEESGSREHASGKQRSVDSWKNHPDAQDVPVFIDDSIDDAEVHE